MSNFWLVFRKELRCCGRDPDVFIYGFVLPLVLYPLSAVFVNEGTLWYSSMQERNRDTIYVVGVSPLAKAVASGLRRNKHYNVVDDNFKIDPAVEDLKKNAVAVVAVDADKHEISIKAHETSSHLGTISDQIETQVREARFAGLKSALQDKKIPLDILNVFTVDRQGLKKPRTTVTANQETKELFDKLVALLVVFMILMMTVIGGPASVCMMAEEHEKKTFLTTLLAPIDRLVIIIAKFLTVTVICVGGATVNLICITLFIAFLFLSLLSSSFSFNQLINDFQHLTVTRGAYYLSTGAIFVHRLRQFIPLPSFSEILLMVATFFSTGALLSAVYLWVASYAKTVKSAQTLVSLPMIFLLGLPTIAMIPGVQFNARTALIPIANLLIMGKYDNPPLILAIVALIEPFLICLLILFWIRRNFENQIEGKKSGSRSNKGKQVKAT